MKDLREAAADIIDSYIYEWKQQGQRVRPMSSKRIAKSSKTREILAGQAAVSPEAFKSMNRRQKTMVLSGMPSTGKLNRDWRSEGNRYKGSHPAVAVSDLIHNLDLGEGKFGSGIFEGPRGGKIKYNKDGSVAGAVFKTVDRAIDGDYSPIYSRDPAEQDDIPTYNHEVHVDSGGNWKINRVTSDGRFDAHVGSGTHKDLDALLDHVQAIGDPNHKDHESHHGGDMYLGRSRRDADRDDRDDRDPAREWAGMGPLNRRPTYNSKYDDDY